MCKCSQRGPYPLHLRIVSALPGDGILFDLRMTSFLFRNVRISARLELFGCNDGTLLPGRGVAGFTPLDVSRSRWEFSRGFWRAEPSQAAADALIASPDSLDGQGANRLRGSGLGVCDGAHAAAPLNPDERPEASPNFRSNGHVTNSRD
jgi:hypothetical protein